MPAPVPAPPPVPVPSPPPVYVPVPNPPPTPVPVVVVTPPPPVPAPVPAPVPGPVTASPPPPPAARVRSPPPLSKPLVTLAPSTGTAAPCALDTASGIVVEVRLAGSACSDALMDAVARAIAQVSGTADYCHVTKCRLRAGRVAVRTKLHVDIAPYAARKAFKTAFNEGRYATELQGQMGAGAGAYTVHSAMACYFPSLTNCVY